MVFSWENSKTKVFHGSLPAEIKADIVVCDENTKPFLPAGVPQERVVLLPPGERAKTWASVEGILNRAVDRGLDRSSLFLGVGGGVITDLTAFAASIYMRGARLALKPTTLLAMVDAALGGKTGFDFRSYKNLVGTFYPASTLIVDTACLNSLPEREYRSGLAEVVKTAMIGDAPLLDLLEEEVDALLARDPALMGEVVTRCLRVKGRIVEDDLREKGGRAVLNLGHTFAHALESVTHFRWSHGEAVSWGLVKSLGWAEELGLLPPDSDYRFRVTALLKRLGLPVSLDSAHGEIQGKDLYEAMAHDKKSRGGCLPLIIPRKPGVMPERIPLENPQAFINFLP